MMCILSGKRHLGHEKYSIGSAKKETTNKLSKPF